MFGERSGLNQFFISLKCSILCVSFSSGAIPANQVADIALRYPTEYFPLGGHH